MACNKLIIGTLQFVVINMVENKFIINMGGDLAEIETFHSSQIIRLLNIIQRKRMVQMGLITLRNLVVLVKLPRPAATNGVNLATFFFRKYL